MTRVGEALRLLRHQLGAQGIPDAALEAEVLVMAALGTDRASLYAQLNEPLPPGTAHDLARLAQRRGSREPLAYIVGRREFYGLSFHVGPGVLVPRPETELLVEEALAIAGRRFTSGRCTIVDVGTGSGAIAVALAVRLPQARLIATDVSAAALRIADVNRRLHGVAERVHLLRADLLGPIGGRVDMVVSNPPYVASAELATLEPEVRLFEPREALCGGPDGLDIARRLLPQAAQCLCGGGALLVELDPRQMAQAAALTGAAFATVSQGVRIRVARDLAGRERVLVVEVFGQGS